jgi:hypothetical protein
MAKRKNNDRGYKLLFSYPEMVRDLLVGFVDEEWVRLLDWETLQHVGGTFVSDDLREREDDIIWRVRFADRQEWLYLYVILEFQSEVDRFMAVRLATYVGLLYQDLVRTKQLAPDRKLPPVLPIVLYNGEGRWSAPTDIRELVAPAPASVTRHALRLRYLVIDERRLAMSAEPESRNLAAALFRLEQSRDDGDILRTVRELAAWLAAPGQAELRRSFAVWVRRVVEDVGSEPIAAEDLTEVVPMLENRMREWKTRWRAEARVEGRAEGRAEALRTALSMLVEQRFGRMSEALRERVESADEDDLRRWTSRVLGATTTDDVFAD